MYVTLVEFLPGNIHFLCTMSKVVKMKNERCMETFTGGKKYFKRTKKYFLPETLCHIHLCLRPSSTQNPVVLILCALDLPSPLTVAEFLIHSVWWFFFCEKHRKRAEKWGLFTFNKKSSRKGSRKHVSFRSTDASRFLTIHLVLWKDQFRNCFSPLISAGAIFSFVWYKKITWMNVRVSEFVNLRVNLLDTYSASAFMSMLTAGSKSTWNQKQRTIL